jgi:hypothetical protein
MDTLVENAPSLTDVEAGARCITCPVCLDCDFDNYRGQPFVAEDWVVYDPQTMLVSSEAPTVVQYPGSLARSHEDIPEPLRTERVRDVYGCPYEGACKLERSYRNETSYKMRLDTACKIGFGDALCAVCERGYSRTKEGCSLCENVGSTMGSFASLCGVLLVVIILRRWKKRRKSEHPNMATTYLLIFAKVIPELAGDFRVFISVYQMLTNLGQTLAITFPDVVEEAISYMREIVNIDIFSFAAITCITGSNYYQKLWLAILVPIVLIAAVWLNYHKNLAALHLDHLPDAEALKQEEQARKQLDEVHSKRRLAKQAGRKERIRFGFVRLYHHVHDERSQAEENAEDAHERAFEHDRKLRKIYKKLEKKAEIQQASVSVGFFVIFMVSVLSRVLLHACRPGL